MLPIPYKLVVSQDGLVNCEDKPLEFQQNDANSRRLEASFSEDFNPGTSVILLGCISKPQERITRTSLLKHRDCLYSNIASSSLESLGPNSKKPYKKECDVVGKIASCDLPTEFLCKAGELQLQYYVHEDSVETWHSQIFTAKIEPSLDDGDAIAPSGALDVLSSLLAAESAANSAASNVQELISDIKGRLERGEFIGAKGEPANATYLSSEPPENMADGDTLLTPVIPEPTIDTEPKVYLADQPPESMVDGDILLKPIGEI